MSLNTIEAQVLPNDLKSLLFVFQGLNLKPAKVYISRSSLKILGIFVLSAEKHPVVNPIQ